MYSIGYYRKRDLAFLGPAVASLDDVLDRYFAAILAETYPNRFYQHAAQTDRLDNTFDDLDAAHDLGPPGGRRG